MAGSRQTSWGVCATVNEPTEVLETFITHYGAIGASEIFLFFDQPDEAVMAALSSRAASPACPRSRFPTPRESRHRMKTAKRTISGMR